MEWKDGNSDIDSWEDILLIGPLVLDKSTKEAKTVYNSELFFTPCEFDALLALASRENEAVTLERLIEIVWGTKEGANRYDEARESIENVIKQINANDGFFMHIDYHPENGYTFKTRWSHNKEEWMISVKHSANAEMNSAWLTNATHLRPAQGA